MATMRTMVRVRETDTEDLMLQIEAYRRKLAMYPVNDVLVVLERWPDDHEFWPTWQELKSAMDGRMEFRRAQHRPRLEHQSVSEPPRSPPTRGEVEAELARLRDPSQEFLCRQALIKLGETMLARLA